MRQAGRWHGRLAIAAGVLSLCGAGAPTLAQSLGDTSSVGPSTARSTTGEQTYRDICQACHMAHAEGGVGAGRVPALAGDPHLSDPDFVLARVLHGQGGMPAFADMLSAEQIAGVTNYVRTHFGNAYTGTITAGDVRRRSTDAASD